MDGGEGTRTRSAKERGFRRFRLTASLTRLAWHDAFAFSRIGDLLIRLPNFLQKRIRLNDRLILFRPLTTVRRPGFGATSGLLVAMRTFHAIRSSCTVLIHVRVKPDDEDEYWNIL